jgi:tRNA-specific 2-thiouridylase
MTSSKKKVLCAMSGGVDSSVAAALLLREGYEVVGAFMRLGTPDGVEAKNESCSPGGKTRGCCSVLDADDARRVAAALDIPFYVLNFQDEFSRVIDYFVDEYNRGRTPNPCVRCNDWLKFGRLTKYAEAIGADFVASGHYARVEHDGGEARLLRGIDATKDQSYVLFGISRSALAHTLLPIGGYEKHQVRAMAQELGLPVYNKPDSQEICFVPQGKYTQLVRRRKPEAFRAGEFADSQGTVLGTHEGHQHFTIGQRKGVGIALGEPAYVVSIDAERNRVTLGSRDDLLKPALRASQLNILCDRLAAKGKLIRCSAKIRYNHAPQPGLAEIDADGLLRVRFDQPQSAITPGQAVVVYDGPMVLGGGWIDAATD